MAEGTAEAKGESKNESSVVVEQGDEPTGEAVNGEEGENLESVEDEGEEIVIKVTPAVTPAAEKKPVQKARRGGLHARGQKAKRSKRH